ncbi:UNVERIFIED_CONTAM: retm [Trichonephila clavipes]
MKLLVEDVCQFSRISESSYSPRKMSSFLKVTIEEQAIIDELKKRTIKDVTPKMLEDETLFYRFAKARDFNIEDAESMLRKHLAWRKEMRMDTFLTDYKPPEVRVLFKN